MRSEIYGDVNLRSGGRSGFGGGPTLFTSKSMIVFDNPLGKCGAYANT